MSTNGEPSTPPAAGETAEPHAVEPRAVGPRAAGPTRRALRTMAVVRWSLLLLVSLLAGHTVWTYWISNQSGQTVRGEDRYYCPMHPQIRSHDPGECPICHMNLEPIPQERQSPSGARQAMPPESSPLAASAASAPSNVTAITLSDDQQRAVGLGTSVAENANLGDRLRVAGVINAPESGIAQARVRAPGFVEQVNVRQTGVRVSRGQPLAFVYSPEIYRAEEEFITANRWSSSESTGPAGAGAGEIAAAAKRGLELLGMTSTEIEEITRTGKPIRAIAVRAPAAGYVTRFNAVLGSRAEPETVLYEIADLSKVWVIASVPERDLNGVQVGTVAQFTTTGNATEPVTCKVDLIEPLLEESTRTTRVRLVVANRDGRLRPGQFGEVEFELAKSRSVVIPRDAVIRTGEHDYVYVATATDRFEPRLVRTGLERDGRLQVLAGLAEGERVVTRGSFMLDSESRLQASLRAAPGATSATQAAAAPSATLGPGR